MNIFVIVLSTAVSLFNIVLSRETVDDLSCRDFKEDYIGSIFYTFSSKPTYGGSSFYLASLDKNVKISQKSWKALKGGNFIPTRKTLFIIHGYTDDYTKEWVTKMKKALLRTNYVNLILIDWSDGSQTWNYVNAVQSTYSVAQDIVKFLEKMDVEVSKMNKSNKNTLWKNLYFIGHSLGAHISGQVGHILRSKSSSFTIERITGLDPAQPCFKHINHIYKLDANDANFVDVMHTQTGNGGDISGFGLQEPTGHLDFYVNGGVMQPECENIITLPMELRKKICSHNLAHTYFTFTVDNAIQNNCKLIGYNWNGSFNQALQILNEVGSGNQCLNCVEMGIKAINNQIKKGRYLVLTSASKPYCQFKKGDKGLLKQEFERLNTVSTLFPQLPSNPLEDFNLWPAA